jgi:hypothetical protein
VVPAPDERNARGAAPTATHPLDDQHDIEVKSPASVI